MSGGWIHASVSRLCTAWSQSRWRIGPPRPPGWARESVAGRATRRRGRPHRRKRSTDDAPPVAPRRRDRRALARSPRPDRALAGTSVRNRDNAAVSSRIHEARGPIAAGMPCNTTARRDRGGIRPQPPPSRARATELLDQQRLDVAWRECGPTLTSRDTATRTRNGSRPSRSPACATASSNGRCSKACSVLWWMKTVMGPWAGSRWATSSMTQGQGMVGRAGIR